jgi:hypothetical protein
MGHIVFDIGVLAGVLNGREFLDHTVNVLCAGFSSNGIRQNIIGAITTNRFNLNALASIEEFLVSNGGLIGELKNQYQPPHNVQLSDDHQALLTWALHQQVPEHPNGHQTQHTLKQLWEQLASTTVLTDAMYLQLHVLSSAAHNPAQGVVNPNLPIRIALANNPWVPPQLLATLSQPQEHRDVRLTAIENTRTPLAAVESCLQQEEDVHVLLAAARRTFPRRTAGTQPTAGEAQLRARGIADLNGRLDSMLINGQGAARRLF